jgi:CO/xanthine dehydrogenase FAD-binding subunit
VEVVIRLWVSDDVIKDVVVAAGAVANVPIRLTSAETVLRGCAVTDMRARLADVTISGTHLETTSYKQPLLRGCLAAVAAQALAPEPAAPVDGLALEWRL